MIQAGLLRHRIVWEKKDPVTQNATGEEVETYTDEGPFWARVQPLRGDERFDAQKLDAHATTRITVRGGRDFSIKDRLRFLKSPSITIRYEILHIQHVEERDAVTVLTCRERPR